MCRLLHVGADYGTIMLEDAPFFILGEPTSPRREGPIDPVKHGFGPATACGTD
jgi:hypothetical protein